MEQLQLPYLAANSGGARCWNDIEVCTACMMKYKHAAWHDLLQAKKSEWTLIDGPLTMPCFFCRLWGKP